MLLTSTFFICVKIKKELNVLNDSLFFQTICAIHRTSGAFYRRTGSPHTLSTMLSSPSLLTSCCKSAGTRSWRVVSRSSWEGARSYMRTARLRKVIVWLHSKLKKSCHHPVVYTSIFSCLKVKSEDRTIQSQKIFFSECSGHGGCSLLQASPGVLA